MRLSTSSSVILATLASSVSFGQLAAAAPAPDDAANGLGLTNGISSYGPLEPLLGGGKSLLRSRRFEHTSQIQLQWALTNAERYRTSQTASPA